MKTDAELESENASAASESAGQGEPREPTATPPGSEAAASAGVATDQAPAKAEIAKAVEPSVNSGKTSPTGIAPVGKSFVAVASIGAVGIDLLGDALAALERRDYATAQRLFEALGHQDAAQAITDALAALDRRDYAAAQGLFDALSLKGSAAGRGTRPATAMPARAGLAALAAGRIAGAEDKARSKSAAPLEVVPAADAAYRRPAAAERKPRGLRPALFGAGLVIAAVFGASALYGSPLNWTLSSMKGQTIAALASTVHVLKAPLEAIQGASGREEERTEIGDLRAALTQATIRLDRIEQDYGARLDKLGAPIDQKAAAPSAEIAARLDRLEEKAAAPSAEFADVAGRLDKLEKKAPAAAAPSAQLADLTTRLNRLEKAAGVAAANPAKPLAPGAPKQSTLLARAEPSASNEIAKPDNAKPLLRNYSIEDVQDGMAVVDSRYGAQQVGPGDFIPGAGRVLRIERRGRDWFVVTSQGVIGSGPGPY